MKGKHHIIIETDHLKYEFDIKRNITVIQGDSATGKTTLIGLLQEYGIRREASGIRLQSDVPCEVYAGSSELWQTVLSTLFGRIVFIDEGYPFIYSKAFAEFIDHSDNYFVLITRKPMRNLPYSINEIYGIRTSGKYHFPDKVYQEFYPIYANNDIRINTKDKLLLMVEDERSGYQFFSRTVDIPCIGVGGNSKFYGRIREMDPAEGIVIIADGSAFGCFIQDMISLREQRDNVSIYMPESFEWIILRSGVVNYENLNDVLDHPEDYIDSALYLSWERFFTDLLKKITKDDNIREYHKSKIKDYYLQGQVRSRILSVLPDELLEIIENKV